jgi:p-cumate 2,3-dioxygenase alpha subunit
MTQLSCIDDDTARGLFRVSRRAFTSAEVLEAERARIFARSWLYLGHESEVPEPGSFRAREVGGRPLIFVRSSDGQLRVFLNACTHRGAQVCREKSGRAKSFQCFYHGWTFANDGRLIGVPSDEAYPPGFARERLGLASPRVESYRGFVFVRFSEAGESLADYLAGAKEYLDLIADQSEVGMEIVGGSQSYGIRANWKLLVENSFDGYHAQIAHARYLKYVIESGGMGAIGVGRNSALDLGNGHAVIEYEAPWGRPVARWVPSFGAEAKDEIAAIRARLEQRLGRERAARISSASRNLVIFPNLVINDIMAITVRTFFPVAPDAMTVDAWSLAPREESREHRRHRLENFLTFLGPGGFATPDDIEALECCQRGYLAAPDGWNDISRETHVAQPSFMGEHQIRTFWRRWQQLIAPQPARRRLETRHVAAV